MCNTFSLLPSSLLLSLLLVIPTPPLKACLPDALGQFDGVKLGSVENITTHMGNDVQFICCGGTRWTYESDPTRSGKEIGPPSSAVAALDFQASISPDQLRSTQPPQHDLPQHNTAFSMLDDKNRLILQIHNAEMSDAGHYVCHGPGGKSADAFLEVVTKIRGRTTIFNPGQIIPHLMMFSFEESSMVLLNCPVTGAQSIKYWLWAEARSTETFKTNQQGVYSNNNVEIGPRLEWARIVNPLSPDAPTKLWCQFEAPSTWGQQEPIMAFYEIDWELYEPIEPRIIVVPPDLNLRQRPSTTDTTDQPHTTAFDSGVSSIIRQIDRLIATGPELLSRHASLLENKPAQLACRFRTIDVKVIDSRRPRQQVDWFRNDRLVSVPPFHVDNTWVASHGISLLSVRAYPSLLSEDEHLNGTANLEKQAETSSETITCKVTSELKQEPVYRIENNASLEVDVILVPTILNGETLTTERTIGEPIQLTCTARANGPPQMRFEFSNPAVSASQDQDLSPWTPLQPKRGMQLYEIQRDPQDPLIYRLVLDIPAVERSYHGHYRCQVWNQAGRAQVPFKLMIRAPPSLDIQLLDSAHFLEHKPWEVACLVSGYPLALALTPNVTSGQGQQPQSNRPGQMRQPVGTHATSVRLSLFEIDGTPITDVETRTKSYRANRFSGINATYALRMTGYKFNALIVRCQYEHLDGQVITKDRIIRAATRPSPPNVTVLCVGPQAVVFGVTNPKYSPDSLPTERIVTQKVIFWPDQSPMDDVSSNQVTLNVYLDEEGQPAASPLNDSTSSQVQFHVTPDKSSYGAPQTAVIPIRGLRANTKYLFEWSSGNQFGLSVMTHFSFPTSRLEPPPGVKQVRFAQPTADFLQFSTYLHDPCPYDGGARPLFSDLVVRLRRINASSDAADKVKGDWSDVEACHETLPPLDQVYREREFDEPQMPTGLQWSGDSPIPCQIAVGDPKSDYEVQVAARNAFGISPWFTATYQYGTFSCYPKCSSAFLAPSSLLLVFASLLFSLL